MISDLFLSPCWSREYFVRLPQFMVHYHQGPIEAPDPVPNRGSFTIFVIILVAVGSKKMQCRHDNFSLCRCYFRSKLARTHGEGGATRQAPNSNTRNGKFVQETFTKPLHLLTFFPNQNGCDFFDRLKCKCSIIHGSRSGYFRDQRGHWNKTNTVKIPSDDFVI